MFPLKKLIRIPFTPIATYSIVLVNIIVSCIEDSLSAEDTSNLLRYALVPQRYFDPAWARLHGLDPKNYLPFVTGIFMHGGFWHILLNMWTLLIFGRSLEGPIGWAGFLSFYLTCGVVASYAHADFNANFAVPALGASGAIAGVLGAYASTFPGAKISILILAIIVPFFIKISAFTYALVWFGAQFMEGVMHLSSPGASSGIAWWAHIGGFLAGLALIPLWRQGPDRTYDEEQVRHWGDWPEGRAKGWSRGPWDR